MIARRDEARRDEALKIGREDQPDDRLHKRPQGLKISVPEEVPWRVSSRR
jgi:hypothetical protein